MRIIYFLISILVLTTSLFSNENYLVRDGVTYEKIETSTPLVIHVVTCDFSKVKLEAVRALNDGLGTELLTEISERTGGIAAINSGFFSNGNIFHGRTTSTLKINKNWLSIWKKPRACIGFTKDFNAYILDRLIIKPLVTIKGENGEKKFELKNFNEKRTNDMMVLYSYAFHRSTLTPPTGIEILINKLTLRKAGTDRLIKFTFLR